MADYGFLFPKLRGQAWVPPGADDRERVANLRTLARDLYAPSEEGTLAAAYTFFGQLVTHDVSFDVRIELGDQELGHANQRTSGFDLDCIYGAGPRCHPHLYEQRDPRRLCIGRNANGEPDLPRSQDSSLDGAATRAMNLRRVALIADPRNDENIVTAQLHLAFLKFHNLQVQRLGDFERAREQTRLHYQWVLLHDYLAQLCSPALLDALQRPGAVRFFPRSEPVFVPYEFALAAFRFGHSMVGPRYFLNDALEEERIPAFPLHDFYAVDWISRDANAARLLDGQRVLPPRWSVQWDRFLPGDPEAGAQRAQQIDMRIDGTLRQLPMPANRDLAFRTLLRGWQVGLPSGQAVAAHINETVLDPDDKHDDPLWIYVLREAQHEAEKKRLAEVEARDGRTRGGAAATGAGRALGPVAARIVAEVCVRLLEEGPKSLLGGNRGWQPEAVKQGGSYTLRDFLADAGAPITRAQWDAVVPRRSQSAK
jgi:hypothetical protein